MIERLTPKEREVAMYYVKDLQRKEIADIMGIKVGTVKTHQHNIYTKLNVRNKIELIKATR